MLGWLLCRVGCHAWEIDALSSRAIWLANLSPLAGTRAHCKRCGAQWDDIPADYVRTNSEGKDD
jgi:hypothetical protein